MSRHNTSTAVASNSGGAAMKKVTTKKFCTRGEEFFDFLKALGYQPSKHQQAEHFEYLFQDEKSEKLVRKLMATLKTENCLLLEDIQRYEDLKKQGFALYGTELEEAVTRRRAINEMYNQNKHKKVSKRQQMEVTLQEQHVDVQQLVDYRDMVFQKEVEEWPIRQNKVSNILSVVNRIAKEYEKEIDIDVQMLNEKTEELEAAVVQLKKNLDPAKGKGSTGQYLCQTNVKSIMKREEVLYEKLKQMITKHATELIMKDAGYALEGDPLNEENMRKIFVQFEKDFERLKHCIIYERVRQIQLEIELAGNKGTMDKLEECRQKAAQLGLLDFNSRAKLQMECRDSINDLTTAFEKANEELETQVRELTYHTVNQQFRAITDIKARAKKKLLAFFSQTTKILKAQLIRVSLLRNLVKNEGKLYGRLIANIEDNIAASNAHYKRSTAAPKMQGPPTLTVEGEILNNLLIAFGIPNPTEILVSLPKIYQVVSKILNEVDNDSYNAFEESKKQLENANSHLGKMVQVLKDVQEQSEKAGAVVATILEEKEAKIKEKTEELKTLQVTRTGSTKDRNKQRTEANAELRNILAEINK